MHTGRTVFAQLMDLLPLRDFRACVARYDGDYKVRAFSCLDQFLTLAFAQLTHRDSLRDIETSLRAMQPKLYHMGFRGAIARTTLAEANEARDWRIYADFAQGLITTARGLYATEDLGLELTNTVYRYFARLIVNVSYGLTILYGISTDIVWRDQTGSARRPFAVHERAAHRLLATVSSSGIISPFPVTHSVTDNQAMSYVCRRESR